MSLKLKFPYSPSINHYYGQRGNRRFIKKEGKEYREAVTKEVLKAAPRMGIMDDLIVIIDMYPPDRRKRDIDNVQKCVLDSIEHSGLIIDDCQIVELTTRKHPPIKGGAIHVEVKCVEKG